MMTIKDLMKQCAVSRPTVQSWMKKGLPYYKLDRLVRFKPEEVDKWLGGQKNEKNPS